MSSKPQERNLQAELKTKLMRTMAPETVFQIITTETFPSDFINSCMCMVYNMNQEYKEEVCYEVCSISLIVIDEDPNSGSSRVQVLASVTSLVTRISLFTFAVLFLSFKWHLMKGYLKVLFQTIH